MSDSSRLDKGKEMFSAVYGKNVPLPQGSAYTPFTELMLTNLFGDVWGRETMSVRDRRLILIGAIAALAPDPSMLIEIQLKAALDNGELQREQLREIAIILTQYIGYPRTVPVMQTIEKVLVDTQP